MPCLVLLPFEMGKTCAFPLFIVIIFSEAEVADRQRHCCVLLGGFSLFVASGSMGEPPFIRECHTPLLFFLSNPLRTANKRSSRSESGWSSGPWLRLGNV